ncbi:MAG: hypothetical protein ACHQQQ_11180 [Bacteroidota bacterium]
MTPDRKPDLHVVSLHYTLRKNEKLSYVNPPALKFDSPEGNFELADGKLRCEMKKNFATEEEARKVVDPFLKAWEIDADLRLGRGTLRFDFKRAEIVDRSPVIPDDNHKHIILSAETGAISVAGHSAIICRTQNTYPEPPRSFRLTPDADSLWFRYQGYLDGREPLLSMVYFCLTVLESTANGRNSASRKYNIALTILDKIGDLTSKHGDHRIARKASKGGNPPLTGEECVWLETAVKLLIWRVGDNLEAISLSPITMADLPKI